MKTAIVLCGGGTRGAYEAGVIQAIDELKIPFDIVTGTSIGALNGALLAQHDFQAIYDLWDNLVMEDIIQDGIDLTFSIEELLDKKNLIKSFFKSYYNHKGANITPLKNKIKELYNEEHLINSKVQFGLVCVEYPNLKPIEITYEQMKEDTPNYLLASASCFPAFPICEFNNKSYIDGGYYDNLPIHLAISMGAKQIIAIELRDDKVTHPHYMNRPNIKIIRPSSDIGMFLDFDRKILDFRKRLGYLDGLKAFDQLIGYKYTFNPFYLGEEELLYDMILEYEALINRESIKNKVKIFNAIPLTELIENKTPHPTISDYYIGTLEILMELYDYDLLQVYDIIPLKEELISKFKETLENVKEITTMNNDSIFKLKDFLQDLSKKELTAFFYHKIKNDSYEDSNWIYPLFSKELLCGFLLHLWLD